MLKVRRATPGAGWESVLAYLERGTVLVVGAAGMGKTSLAGFLTAQLGRSLRRVAQVDADPGQTSIGPAGCLGLALTGPWRAPAAQWFVGDRKAHRTPLPVVVGTARLAERARREGAEVVVVDAPAPGDGDGRAPDRHDWELLHHLTLATGANQVVALARDGELRPYADVVSSRVELFRVPGPPDEELPVAAPSNRVRGRDELRHRAAEARLRAHLADCRPMRFARRRILDTAWTPGADPGRGAVAGLIDEQGFCLALGVVDEVADDSVVVLTPWRDRRAVARLQVGALRARQVEGPGDEPAPEWRLV